MTRPSPPIRDAKLVHILHTVTKPARSGISVPARLLRKFQSHDSSSSEHRQTNLMGCQVLALELHVPQWRLIEDSPVGESQAESLALEPKVTL